MIEFVFKDYLTSIGHLKSVKTHKNQIVPSGAEQTVKKEEKKLEELKASNSIIEDEIKSNWQNGVFVIAPTRLGLNKVNMEYFSPILSVFQTPLNVGIIGGRPSQALYFVGA
jgi:hypothetical protein